ncbi:G-type lectin S-receptor-like serine/threonine-protein kinase LECRK3 isoform X2 [Mercurialis annua]|uniref:G-type lectin S-receptor-like serine/threonine-protein kinase LECRK3 isoform X2 n=1 Tax=Mercurialis annua TaxID=3986 RepID=UPI00215E17FA|nr:G-type lectin S-receptor-like serine/threonine-protein kinase LECRK3 isoform X2 [Mercurialis annua]XP_050224053.1 G-type lectin S-receptor-like serine/threonine-protein kinase LECRK3 isoform X2 [Mercurialis annua]
MSSHCIYVKSVLPIHSNAQTNTNISLGSSLTAQNDNAFWLSPSGDFAFGFQRVDTGYLLAIWFHKIPERTIVWSANRNNLVEIGSKVQLTRDGRLVLNDQSNRLIWNANSVAGVSYAAMLDTGNFVLADQDSVTLWGSFDEPTDTILPTQTMDQGSELIARYSERNYSNGRFKFSLQTDGNLLLYTTIYPFDTTNAPYWSTQSSIGSGFQVIFNQSGYVFLVARNGSILNYVFSNAASTRDFYQRATIDLDGPFRHYVYPKNASSSAGKWPSSWTILSFIPGNICTRIEGNTGSGACGFNSYCELGDDQRPNCRCPPGYSFLDPNDKSKGCKQGFVAQNCDAASQETESFDLVEMPNTDWPLSDYESFNPVSEDWCREACLSDCYCSVAIFRNQDCWKKRIPISNGRIDPGVGGKALIKVRRDNSTSSLNKNDNSTLILIGSVFLGSSGFLNLLLLIAAVLMFLNRRSQQRSKIVEPTSLQVTFAMNPRSFSYNELDVATGGFKEELGSGSFGTVYKGAIESEDTKLIAVKKLKEVATQGDKEFEAEVNIIGGTNHKNLVKLVGFCNENKHRQLVYEYMSNGSLASFLFGNSRRNWYKRRQIAFGIARGLSYLHEECRSQIIHCDIKPQNVLLDETFTARISDFGLAKLLKTDQSQTTTAIRGTKGFVAPEWFKNMPITSKVDVYSFGILLLELICCKRNFQIDAEGKNPVILADWAYDSYKDGNVHTLVEDEEEAVNDIKRVERFVMVAIWCIQDNPSLRPAMNKVIHMLEGAVQVSVPPDPTSFFSTSLEL